MKTLSQLTDELNALTEKLDKDVSRDLKCIVAQVKEITKLVEQVGDVTERELDIIPITSKEVRR